MKRAFDFIITVVVTALPFVFVAVLLFLMGCGNPGEGDTTIRTYKVGSCSVEEVEEGANIKCPDGTSVVVRHGQDGLNGQDGTDGVDGQNGTDGKDGVDGVDGTDGKDGEDGKTIRVSNPLYVGYYCSRTVLKIGGKVYVLHGGLVQLSDKWFKVSNSCKLRYKSGKIEQR